MKTLGKLATLIFISIIFTPLSLAQDIWVTAKKIGEGPNQFIQGNHVKECKYSVDYKFNFSITITEWVCPYSVQYNMMTKEWKAD